MAALGAMYAQVSAQEDVLFWWVGDAGNWENVYCAFEGDQMVAKGQLQLFNVVPPGRSAESKHKIFVNLKTVPGREKDLELRDSVYALLLERAQVLKRTLPRNMGPSCAQAVMRRKRAATLILQSISVTCRIAACIRSSAIFVNPSMRWSWRKALN